MNARRDPHHPLLSEGVKPLSDDNRFPLTIFLACLGSLAGLYYGLLWVFPADFSQSGEPVEGMLASLTAAVVAHPVLTALAMLAAVVPGLVFYFEDRRRYFLTLLLVTLVLWGTSFVYARSPADALGKAIDTLLNSERELPDLNGTKKVGGSVAEVAE